MRAAWLGVLASVLAWLSITPVQAAVKGESNLVHVGVFCFADDVHDRYRAAAAHWANAIGFELARTMEPDFRVSHSQDAGSLNKEECRDRQLPAPDPKAGTTYTLEGRIFLVGEPSRTKFMVRGILSGTDRRFASSPTKIIFEEPLFGPGTFGQLAVMARLAREYIDQAPRKKKEALARISLGCFLPAPKLSDWFNPNEEKTKVTLDDALIEEVKLTLLAAFRDLDKAEILIDEGSENCAEQGNYVRYLMNSNRHPERYLLSFVYDQENERMTISPAFLLTGDSKLTLLGLITGYAQLYPVTGTRLSAPSAVSREVARFVGGLLERPITTKNTLNDLIKRASAGPFSPPVRRADDLLQSGHLILANYVLKGERKRANDDLNRVRGQLDNVTGQSAAGDERKELDQLIARKRELEEKLDEIHLITARLFERKNDTRSAINSYKKVLERIAERRNALTLEKTKDQEADGDQPKPSNAARLQAEALLGLGNAEFGQSPGLAITSYSLAEKSPLVAALLTKRPDEKLSKADLELRADALGAVRRMADAGMRNRQFDAAKSRLRTLLDHDFEVAQTLLNLTEIFLEEEEHQKIGPMIARSKEKVTKEDRSFFLSEFHRLINQFAMDNISDGNVERAIELAAISVDQTELPQASYFLTNIRFYQAATGRLEVNLFEPSDQQKEFVGELLAQAQDSLKRDKNADPALSEKEIDPDLYPLIDFYMQRLLEIELYLHLRNWKNARAAARSFLSSKANKSLSPNMKKHALIFIAIASAKSAKDAEFNEYIAEMQKGGPPRREVYRQFSYQWDWNSTMKLLSSFADREEVKPDRAQRILDYLSLEKK